MGVNVLLRQEADTVTEKPVKIPFKFEGIPEDKKTTVGDSIVIRPMTVRTWFEIKPLLAKIAAEDLSALQEKERENNTPFDEKTREIIGKYDELLFDIVCKGIHNKQGEMPMWFREVLKQSCAWEDIYILLNAILYRLSAMAFLNSIIVLRTVSPLGEREIIALQENRKAWLSKAVSGFSQRVTKPSDTNTVRHSTAVSAQSSQCSENTTSPQTNETNSTKTHEPKTKKRSAKAKIGSISPTSKQVRKKE